jgi:hypothetical protein
VLDELGEPRDFPPWPPPPTHVPWALAHITPVGHVAIEEMFQAALAARALQGQRDRLRPPRIATPCPRCPPSVHERCNARRAEQVWNDIHATSIELSWEDGK